MLNEMFCSRWAPPFKGWRNGHIVQATSKNLLGPYSFKKVVLDHREGVFYDSNGLHNVKVMKYGDKYVLYYISASGKEYQATEEYLSMGKGGYRTGYAIADSIEGPWHRPKAPVGARLNNPAILERKDGSVYMLVKMKDIRNSANHTVIYYLLNWHEFGNKLERKNINC